MVTPDVQKAIQDARDEINIAEEMDQINFYSRPATSIRGPHMVQQMGVKDQLKAVRTFSLIDKCLPIADWNDPMGNTESLSQPASVGQV